MRTYYRKAWEIVGFTYDGAAYCCECAADLKERHDAGHAMSGSDWPRPVFVSDEYDGMSCDSCLLPLE